MTELAIHPVVYRSPLYEEMLALRTKVLREPLGLEYTKEYLDNDAKDAHFVAQENGKVVGCFMLARLKPDTFKLRQMAVTSDRQKSGIGGAMLAAADEIARKEGVTAIVTHARESARLFYEKHGYVGEGGIFIEATIPHRRMVKRLR